MPEALLIVVTGVGATRMLCGTPGGMTMPREPESEMGVIAGCKRDESKGSRAVDVVVAVGACEEGQYVLL